MTGDALAARATTRGTASGKLRTWARSVLAGEWTEETVLDVVVVLEELASHVCRGGRPAQVRLSYRTGKRLRIEVDDERAVPRSLGSDIGALLGRHLARDSGVRRWRRGAVFWAEVALIARRVPDALPGGAVLGPFEPGARSPN